MSVVYHSSCAALAKLSVLSANFTTCVKLKAVMWNRRLPCFSLSYYRSLSIHSFLNPPYSPLFCLVLLFHLPCPLPLSFPPPTHTSYHLPIKEDIYVCKAVQRLLTPINVQIYCEVFNRVVALNTQPRSCFSAGFPFIVSTLQPGRYTLTNCFVMSCRIAGVTNFSKI